MIELYTVYYINTDNDINYNEIIQRLLKIGYNEEYLNEFSFCPYLLLHLDYKTSKYPVYENVNKGYLDALGSKCVLKECESEDEFIEIAQNLYRDKKEKTGLF